MIPKNEILELATQANLQPHVVEKDYRKENGVRQTYLIEPYSLRATREGKLLLYGVKLPAGQIRCFRTDRIISAVVTQTAFAPRYLIEFLPEGPMRLRRR